ncbi:MULTISPECIES: bifunctional metallophosphatase/5'-nucleotidase [unclassified Streptomyces]|uniref:bifunctional metallophosphatase/5'-nucleotidase n=1 Tax=unclassified Streptomyces TaxID=2593676 RepID=UPI0022B6B3F0|nr:MULTISPECIES: bifunctional metallophosphatase/5'-nucleotidase [unclassified Streptomyces]MCZ7415014.1 bifunctional metallophosphatase/5'-nucleotidase [Streptomyces sp. WMMC897]MCZ7431958.1 bifunctional metallophosphatase/5'-nucleotidase [Streptomyces sp. WMMC1477]
MSTPPGSTSGRRFPRRLAATAAGLAAAVALGAAALPSAQAASERPGDRPGHPGHGPTVDLQVLAVNDFHGHLEPPSGSSGRVTREHPDGTTEQVAAGGAEYLATALREAREGERYTMTVAPGDVVGASPLLSGLFHDEPTIEAMNALGMDVVGVGNHEFDEGREELKRLQDGGCHPVDGCYADGRTFGGADFPILAANVVREDTGKPLLKPYTVKKIRGVRVGFIGVTLEGTPDIVSAEGIKGLKFLDEAETINRYTEELRGRGVNAVIALVHEGGYPANPAYNADCDASGGGISGPIVDIAARTDAGVDALVTGHTHQPYVCSLPDPEGNDRLVTSAASYGRLFTELNMAYDRRTQDIVRASVTGTNHVVHREQARAKDLTELIADWKELAAPVANRPIGHISEDITADRSIPESPLGDLIADAQLAHARTQDEGTELALMNPGGIRADFTYAASGSEGDGVVTYSEGYTVQPFSNTVNIVSLTGDQLLAVLREQVSGANAESPKILQVSEGLTYTLDLTRTGADRVVADSVRLNGEPLAADRVYRVAVNSFLAGGGDGFATLARATDPLVGGDDLKALEQYLLAHSSAAAPLSAPAADRITVVR